MTGLYLQALQGVKTIEEALERYYELPEDSSSADEEVLGVAEAECSDGDDLAYAGSQHHSMLDDHDVPFEIPMGASQCNDPAAPIGMPGPAAHVGMPASAAAAAAVHITARPSHDLPPSKPKSTAVTHTFLDAAAPNAAALAAKRARPSGNADSRRQPHSQILSQQASLGRMARLDSQGSGQSAPAGLGSQVCAVALLQVYGMFCIACIMLHDVCVLLETSSQCSIISLAETCPANGLQGGSDCSPACCSGTLCNCM